MPAATARPSTGSGNDLVEPSGRVISGIAGGLGIRPGIVRQLPRTYAPGRAEHGRPAARAIPYGRRIKRGTGRTIVGPGRDAARIPGIDARVEQGDRFMFGAHPVDVLETPGHTTGHIVYYLPDDGVAFVGDTLFADDVAVFARTRELKDRF